MVAAALWAFLGVATATRAQEPAVPMRGFIEITVLFPAGSLRGRDGAASSPTECRDGSATRVIVVQSSGRRRRGRLSLMWRGKSRTVGRLGSWKLQFHLHHPSTWASWRRPTNPSSRSRQASGRVAGGRGAPAMPNGKRWRAGGGGRQGPRPRGHHGREFRRRQSYAISPRWRCFGAAGAKVVDVPFGAAEVIHQPASAAQVDAVGAIAGRVDRARQEAGQVRLAGDHRIRSRPPLSRTCRPPASSDWMCRSKPGVGIGGSPRGTPKAIVEMFRDLAIKDTVREPGIHPKPALRLGARPRVPGRRSIRRLDREAGTWEAGPADGDHRA